MIFPLVDSVVDFVVEAILSNSKKEFQGYDISGLEDSAVSRFKELLSTKNIVSNLSGFRLFHLFSFHS
jgi:hypothetical protein